MFFYPFRYSGRPAHHTWIPFQDAFSDASRQIRAYNQRNIWPLKDIIMLLTNSTPNVSKMLCK